MVSEGRRPFAICTFWLTILRSICTFWLFMSGSYIQTALRGIGVVCWWVTGRAVLCQEFGAHSRAVNRLNWHSVDEPLLLSASQDTLIKLWDRRGRSFSCQLTFTPRAEAVRDVQWNPHQPHVFAAACENGSLQVWDRRKPASPLLRVRTQCRLADRKGTT